MKMFRKQKSLARNTRHLMPNPFSRRVMAAAAREGVLTYGVVADYSGGTVADFHGLPHFSNLLNVKSSLWCCTESVNIGHFLSLGNLNDCCKMLPQTNASLYR